MKGKPGGITKGYQSILINTLRLQESKDSFAIENIITTHDDLYKSELNLDSFKSLNAKEVRIKNNWKERLLFKIKY
ncbi:MAG TPA: Fic/DOC family N-terminal domain-containing protein [Bacteroidales bacterium]|nr:Fic/DOC family N-terminal domain-containing protein [Bacteroidales bacterium]